MSSSIVRSSQGIVRSLLASWRSQEGAPIARRAGVKVEGLEGRTMLSGAATSGVTYTDSISAVGQKDSWTIDVPLGGALTATAAEVTDGNLYVKLDLFDPNGFLIDTQLGTKGATVKLTNASQAGTYKVQVSDYYNTYTTASYKFTAARFAGTQDAGGDGGALTSGLTKSAAIDVGDIDLFTVNVPTGAALQLVLSETVVSNLSLQVDIFGPNGWLFTNGTTSTGGYLTVDSAPVGGTYTIAVRDSSSTYVGNYALTVAVLPGSQNSGGDAGAITSGSTKTGVVGLGDIDIFTITVPVGGSAFFRLGETNTDTSFYPRLDVYSPDGQLVQTDQGGLGAQIRVTNAQVGGTYYAVVRDYYGAYIGNYNFTAAAFAGAQTNPSDGGAIASGETKTGSLIAGDFDIFTINATAGGTLLFQLSETTATSFYPTIELYAPNGQYLGITQGPSTAYYELFNAPATGTYSFLVRDYYIAPATYSYTATAVSIAGTQNAGGDAGALTSGTTKSANIGIGDLDVFTINVPLGASITAQIAEVSDTGFYPSLALYSPTGKRLDVSQSNIGAYVQQLTANTAGTYYLVARDYYGSTGSYNLTASVTPGTQDSSGDSGYLASGTTRNGSITAGDIDIYSFYAVNGDIIKLDLTSVAGFNFYVEFFAPNGSRLTYASTTTTNSINGDGNNYIKQTGQYFAVVRPVTAGGVGSYSLKLTQTASAPKSTVSITAADAVAVEGGIDDGVFKIFRTLVRALPLTVNFSVAGSAVNGTDYDTIVGSVVIPANAAGVAININAKSDASAEGTEAAVLTLLNNSAYIVDSTAKTATVNVIDAAKVTGNLFKDANGNGIKEAADTNLAGWTVFVDTNNNGILDTGEQSVLTDASGNYALTGLANGLTRIRVKKLVTTYTQTFPTTPYDINLSIGQTASGKNFGFKA